MLSYRDDFAGLSPGVDRLISDYEGGLPSHALLLSGPEGLFKSGLAHFLARALLCPEEGPRPCDSCRSCRRALQDHHSNLLSLSLQPKEKSIKIDQLRSLLKQLSTSPLEAGRRVVLIIDVDLMTVQAQNALLKSLEEPDPDTVFIMTTSNELALLPTVLSRCRVQRLLPWGSERIEGFLQRRGFDTNKQRELSALAHGRPAQALLIDQDPAYLEHRALAEECFFSVRELKDIPAASAKLREARDAAATLLDLVEMQAQQSLSAQLRGDAPEGSWSNASIPALHTLIDEVFSARRYLASNVSWQAVSDRLLLTIAKEIHACPWS